MDSCWSKLKQSLLVVATGVMALSAAAQEGGGGQDIIFSSPKTEDTQAVTPSLTPQNSRSLTLPDTLQAPLSAFPDGSSAEHLTLPPPGYLSDQGRSKLQDERRNWMLMTPAEIFGVTPTEQMLKPPERDAFGREKKPTQLERYLDRESQARAGVTNSWRNDQASLPWSLSRDEDNDNPFARWRNGSADAPQNLSRYYNNQQNPSSATKQNVNFDGTGFDPISLQKLNKEKLDQMATMDRFRQMLNPSPDPAPSPDSRFFPAPKPVVDPYMSPPDFVPNPAGASFRPLNSNIGRPVGLTPLPGIVTPREQPAVIPGWKPQPPPWLSSQPTSFPQQRY